MHRRDPLLRERGPTATQRVQSLGGADADLPLALVLHKGDVGRVGSGRTLSLEHRNDHGWLFASANTRPQPGQSEVDRERPPVLDNRFGSAANGHQLKDRYLRIDVRPGEEQQNDLALDVGQMPIPAPGPSLPKGRGEGPD
jgi:hypothetical protein